ncbi:hypothetical protein QVD17_21621 [Tagetes erecta]|uniref:F-box domain-containing protein n=1 Tax=Tagetes erecta TaxID=13708 RepID=A0AAD8NT23_TARER|nr:hypothetical protein QVD17_21621 [Tagetes erecta]
MVTADLKSNLHDHAHDLPSEIIFFHILPRLPAKSVICFMSVSKQWQALLRSQIFKNMHLRHHTMITNHQKLILFSKQANFYTMDCEAPEEGLITACRDPPFQTHRDTTHLLSSFHGLVCIGVGVKASWDCYTHLDLIIWNPLTREHTTLSKPVDYYKECYKIKGGAFSLYYTSSDDDYKLLRVTNDNDCCYVYSLKHDSWRKVLVDGRRNIPNLFFQAWHPSIWLNEKLYFLTTLGIKFRFPATAYLISRFDTNTEKLIEIEPPPCIKDNPWAGIWSFSVLRGSVHLCLRYNYERPFPQEIQMWRMDGDAGGWTKVLTYKHVPLEAVLHDPMQMMRNGYWIMYFRIQAYFCKLDPDKYIQGDNMTMKIISSPPQVTFTTPFPKATYIETFVSPNRYINNL